MRVLVYIDEILGRNFGAPLELAVQHLKAGDQVDVVVCRGALRACQSNSRHDLLACRLCHSRLDSALAAPSLKGAKVHELVLSADDLKGEFGTFSSSQQLKAYSLDGENIGLEAASSVITVLRDPRPNLNSERELVDNNLRTAAAVYRWFNRMLPVFKPELIYLLNGRRSSQAPVVRAARKFGCNIATHEIGHDAHKYVLIPGTYFHDLERKKADVVHRWNQQTNHTQRLELAERFYLERRYGSGEKFLEAKYKGHQSRGLVPPDFSPQERNLVIFNSSEDEFAAVEGYDNPVYINQIVALETILNDPRLDPNLRIWLRVHPNLIGLKNSQIEAIAKLDPQKIRVIAADEPVDTYALMEGAEKVLTFGSTMSIEAAYASIPSILVGREPYEHLGSCYTPTSHDELMQLINAQNLTPLPKDGALMFGYFMMARDIEYQHYNAVANTLDGHEIRPSWLIWAETRLRWWHPISRLRWWLGKRIRRHLGRARPVHRHSASPSR